MNEATAQAAPDLRDSVAEVFGAAVKHKKVAAAVKRYATECAPQVKAWADDVDAKGRAYIESYITMVRGLRDMRERVPYGDVGLWDTEMSLRGVKRLTSPRMIQEGVQIAEKLTPELEARAVDKELTVNGLKVMLGIRKDSTSKAAKRETAPENPPSAERDTTHQGPAPTSAPAPCPVVIPDASPVLAKLGCTTVAEALERIDQRDRQIDRLIEELRVKEGECMALKKTPTKKATCPYPRVLKGLGLPEDASEKNVIEAIQAKVSSAHTAGRIDLSLFRSAP